MRARDSYFLALCLSACICIPTEGQTPFGGVAEVVLTFRSSVDVNGDGVHTDGDVAVLDWWLEEGGSLSVLLTEAQEVDGLFDVSSYLSSPSARMLVGGVANHPEASVPAQPGSGAAQGPAGGPCDIDLLDPTITDMLSNINGTADAIVTSGQSIQDAINAGQGMTGSGGGPYVIRVDPDQGVPYTDPNGDAIRIDSSQFPAGLKLIAADGPGATIVETGGASLGLPCVLIETSSLAAPGGPIQIGGARTEDPSNWHGFTFRGGRARALGTTEGGGISAVGVEVELKVIGNIVNDNLALRSGGGIGLVDCIDVLVALNEIHGNTAGEVSPPLPFTNPFVDFNGGGVFQNGGNLALIKNEIYNNGFDRPSVVTRFAKAVE